MNGTPADLVSILTEPLVHLGGKSWSLGSIFASTLLLLVVWIAIRVVSRGLHADYQRIVKSVTPENTPRWKRTVHDVLGWIGAHPWMGLVAITLALFVVLPLFRDIVFPVAAAVVIGLALGGRGFIADGAASVLLFNTQIVSPKGDTFKPGQILEINGRRVLIRKTGFLRTLVSVPGTEKVILPNREFLRSVVPCSRDDAHYVCRFKVHTPPLEDPRATERRIESALLSIGASLPRVEDAAAFIGEQAGEHVFTVSTLLPENAFARETELLAHVHAAALGGAVAPPFPPEAPAV